MLNWGNKKTIKAVDSSTAFFMSVFVDQVQMLLLAGFSK